jgi:spore coat protein H
MIEDPGSSIAETYFHDDSDDAIVYKPDGNGARFTTPLGVEAFEQKTGDDETLADVNATVVALHAATRLTQPAVWRANLEQVFDIDTFIMWLAVTRATNDWDQYGEVSSCARIHTILCNF